MFADGGSRTVAGTKNSPFRILDLCTGSGCIGLSLAEYMGGVGHVEIVLSDNSEQALSVAEENIRRLGRENCCRAVRSDLFGAFAGEKFDCIVSNPPYILDGEIADLSPEVRDHEPREALCGGADGLLFYRRIGAEAADYLVPGGRLYLEIGWDQGVVVPEILRGAGFIHIEVLRDLAGNDRVVKAARQ